MATTKTTKNEKTEKRFTFNRQTLYRLSFVAVALLSAIPDCSMRCTNLGC
jgi:hypothetical protein